MTRETLKQALEALQSYNQYITPLTNAFGGPTVPRHRPTPLPITQQELKP